MFARYEFTMRMARIDASIAVIRAVPTSVYRSHGVVSGTWRRNRVSGRIELEWRRVRRETRDADEIPSSSDFMHDAAARARQSTLPAAITGLPHYRSAA